MKRVRLRGSRASKSPIRTDVLGFTSIEVFAALVIIASLVFISVKFYLHVVDYAKEDRTVKAIESIATTLQEYAKKAGTFPEVDCDVKPCAVETLKPFLGPAFRDSLPTRDGWGHPIHFRCNTVIWNLEENGSGSEGSPTDQGGIDSRGTEAKNGYCRECCFELLSFGKDGLEDDYRSPSSKTDRDIVYESSVSLKVVW